MLMVSWNLEKLKREKKLSGETKEGRWGQGNFGEGKRNLKEKNND
jgi:hypothetical protein